MCGLAGFIGRPGPPAVLAARGTAMADTLVHRGPDDAGVWVDAEAGFCLAHRRLAIVDLSPAGHQPMASVGGRYQLAFNGEIYNHAEIRAELQAAGLTPLAWRGHSDTETLLCAIEHWGLQATLKRAVGMFAIALWDRSERTLQLARDRFGEKPLYYGWVGGGSEPAFVFGSELKALRAHPGFDNPVHRGALALYMRYLYVPAPHSIHQGLYKLEPGCLLRIGAPLPGASATALRPPARHGSLQLQRWWRLADAVAAGAADPFTDDASALQALQHGLSRAIAQQSLADVPLGAFLSGGVDSSVIVALMQSQSARPVKTFTIGFDEAAYDESPHAQAVARHLGTEHHALRVTAAEAQAVIARLPAMYDEPFADSSQIPTRLVCAAARRDVTVALSGDAGDELFGGYNRYLWGPRLWRRLDRLPYPLRQALAGVLTGLPPGGWDALAAPLQGRRAGSHGVARVGEKLHKLARSIRGVHDIDGLYRRLVAEWQDPAAVVRNTGQPLLEPATALDDPLPAGLADPAQRMMYLDSLSYLPDDILCKVDRAAMSVSLETRVPFLDHRVAELAWRLPPRMQIRDGQGKWALRQLLYRQVPRALIERPKQGFGIPVGQWLRGPLRAWAEPLLDTRRLEAEGYFHAAPIRERWARHLSGREDHTAALWAVLSFQAWQAENR